MKERYTIHIADVQISIISDEPEELVHATVSQLDSCVRDLTIRNKRCSKLDAALLCALDYLSEKNKAEKKIKNLEAQISLYEATIKRLRAEQETKPAPEARPAPAVKPAPAQMPLTEAVEESEAQPAPAEEAPSLHDDKLRQIEELLRRRTEEPKEAPAPSGDSRSDKLREIEELLRGGGKSLSEALHDAIGK